MSVPKREEGKPPNTCSHPKHIEETLFLLLCFCRRYSVLPVLVKSCNSCFETKTNILSWSLFPPTLLSSLWLAGQNGFFVILFWCLTLWVSLFFCGRIRQLLTQKVPQNRSTPADVELHPPRETYISSVLTSRFCKNATCKTMGGKLEIWHNKHTRNCRFWNCWCLEAWLHPDNWPKPWTHIGSRLLSAPTSHFNRILSAGTFLEANSNSPLPQNRYPYRCPTHELSSEEHHWHDDMTCSWAKTEQWALSSLGDSERTAAEIQRCRKTRCLVRADPGSWCSKMFPITSAPLRYCTSKQKHGEVSPAYT